MHRRAARPKRAVVALLALALTTGLVLAAGPASGSAGGAGKIHAKVLKAVQGGKVTVYWAILRQKADLSGATAIKNRTAQGWFVYNQLTSTAASSQKGLRALLKARGAPAKSFWIINAIRIKSGAATLKAVAARPEVARILPDWSAKVVAPVSAKAFAKKIKAIEWNILNINADDVWNTYNDRGEGITVANIDTGVRWNHSALFNQYRGFHMNPFRPLFPNNNYNWIDPSHICSADGKTVCDNNGHGTHTMGTMVGDDGGANQIGVAPRAHWIAAKGCESSNCSDAALLASGQFMVAPTDLNGQNPRPDLRPHVVNNSWGDDDGSLPFYRATVQAWVAAGIFPAFANGNAGPGCGTVGSPASYPESYGSGAHTINNVIASFSSRGPSPFGGIIKPNISAPGVNVRSSWNNLGYITASGTSMASPHTAAVVALIWSTNGAPSFSRNIAATRMVLDQTAINMSDLTCGGSAGNNNVWGEGRLDAFAAVTAARGS
jgi:subtilisin family serine protease